MVSLPGRCDGYAAGSCWSVPISADSACNIGKSEAPNTATTIVFSLPENPSTGYTWQLRQFTGPALVVTADSFTPSTSEPRPGASGTRTINVFAEAPGMETVVLQLQRPWEKTTPPVGKLAVTITVAADAGR